MNTHDSYDVAVIGAGPAGCVAALAFAQRGARVLLLEARPDAIRPLAGEWIHPPGVEVLRRVGVGLTPESLEHPGGRGFVAFPEDRTEPVVLDYPDGARGLTCPHHVLVSELRRTAAAQANVHYLPGSAVRSIEGQRLGFLDPEGVTAKSVLAGLIVGADGRSSLARRSLGLPDGRRLVSYMAGVVLEGADLPFEGYGHLFLGGPGPMFACRISPHQLRVCIDVPVGCRPSKGAEGYLREAYTRVLPSALRPAFRRALETQAVSWIANQRRHRTHYGREGLALVGDAVGHVHPLTAVGLTLGFLDADALAASPSVAAYRARRSAASRTTELLADSLYRVLTHHDDGAAALRDAVYHVWRNDPVECGRTMRLLSGSETGLGSFSRSFLRVMGTAARQVAGDALATLRVGRLCRTTRDFGGWLRWLATAAIPGAPLPVAALAPAGLPAGPHPAPEGTAAHPHADRPSLAAGLLARVGPDDRERFRRMALSSSRLAHSPAQPS
jgi:2-polyprenyl-6-methoxyphenol hydroxylase-like FAD-dependent oxidoreductase